jgi:hypothetical protein
MLRLNRLLAGLALAGLAVGCGGGGVKEKTVVVKNTDIMQQVQGTLQNYARGQPLASEVTSYDYMIEEVRKIDPAKADILKAGLDDLKKTRGSPAPKAKALLKKLGLEEAKPAK